MGFLYSSPLFFWPPVSLSSAISHLRGRWRFCSFPWCLKPPGVPFHDRRRLQWRGRTVIPTTSQGPWPWTRACRPPLLAVDASTRGAPKLWQPHGLWYPQGLHVARDWEEKKINHTSKDVVHQFGEKEKWPKPLHSLRIYWLRALQDPGQIGFLSISYLFVEDGETV